MLAVAGVVVDNGLVIVHFVNQRVRSHGSLKDAVCEAGAARFRPILLTSLTTTAGVAPLILENSLQAQIVIPMAVAMASGVLFATFVTLFFVPAVYLVLEDIRALVGFRRRGTPAGSAVDPSSGP